jgi:hypothetical protein
MLWQADYASMMKIPTVLNSIIIKTSHAGTISIKMKPHQESGSNTILLNYLGHN